jgi:hypothetical protein
MSAIVARTAVARRGLAPGGWAARVTHTLLVIAVTVVPPGVRGTCVGCPLPGGGHACCAGPVAGVAAAGAAAAVAATHCCGSHASADPGVATDVASADRMPESSVADAADGGPHSPGGCRCWLTARDHAGAVPVPRPAAAGAAFPMPVGLAAAVAMIPPAAAAAPDAADFAPPRPLRVLLCVWRN